MKDNITIGKVSKMIEKSSTAFETSDYDLKRRYLLWNILAFNAISKKVETTIATFGTGYPFYALDSDLKGRIPIISEQIRYNRQLVKDSRKYQKSIYECKSCLASNYGKMKDLKTICKPCPNMPDSIKPRKLINRLPDLDLWLICEDGKLEETQENLKMVLDETGICSSDANPILSIDNVIQISRILKSGNMPSSDMFLPIDAHIIEYSEIERLIGSVYYELGVARKGKKAPYLPVSPKSLRKNWQYDDTSYNFIYDFLSAFTPFDFPQKLNNELIDMRRIVATTFTKEELYDFLLKSATDSNYRRFKSTPELKKIFMGKVESWGRYPKKEKLLSDSKSDYNGPSTDDDL